MSIVYSTVTVQYSTVILLLLGCNVWDVNVNGCDVIMLALLVRCVVWFYLL